MPEGFGNRDLDRGLRRASLDAIDEQGSIASQRARRYETERTPAERQSRLPVVVTDGRRKSVHSALQERIQDVTNGGSKIGDAILVGLAIDTPLSINNHQATREVNANTCGPVSAHSQIALKEQNRSEQDMPFLWRMTE